MSTSLAQALRNAIETETAAERYYEDLATRTEDEDARRFLEDMALQEREHAAGLARFGDSLGGQLPLKADVDLSVVEAGPTWARDQALDFTAALGLAVENERLAQRAYEALGAAAEGAEVTRFFMEMAEAEARHAEQLQDLLDATEALA